MISRLHQFDQKGGEGKSYSVRELCRLFKVNRSWYYQRQKLSEQRQAQKNELKDELEQLLKDYAGLRGKAGD
ncbi:MAG TPA: hypothetical protein VH186_07725 [Chloroflexia bacterium]|nr:hypothetical protein [Chloroflexia bacterium]